MLPRFVKRILGGNNNDSCTPDIDEGKQLDRLEKRCQSGLKTIEGRLDHVKESAERELTSIDSEINEYERLMMDAVTHIQEYQGGSDRERYIQACITFNHYYDIVESKKTIRTKLQKYYQDNEHSLSLDKRFYELHLELIESKKSGRQTGIIVSTWSLHQELDQVIAKRYRHLAAYFERLTTCYRLSGNLSLTVKSSDLEKKSLEKKTEEQIALAQERIRQLQEVQEC